MIFDFPRLRTLLMYVSIPTIIGFAIVRRWGGGEWRFAAWYANCFLTIGGLYVSVFFLACLYDEYKKYNERPASLPPVQPQQHEPLRYADMNKGQYTTVGVRFDARRNFARALVRQWERYKEIDATETTWLKPRVNTANPSRKLPKKWQGKDNEFRACKLDWEKDGILGRTNPDNPKSEFIVRDAVQLRAIAEGRR